MKARTLLTPCTSTHLIGALLLIFITRLSDQYFFLTTTCSTINFSSSWRINHGRTSSSSSSEGLMHLDGRGSVHWPERGYGSHLSIKIYVYDKDEIDGLQLLMYGKDGSVSPDVCIKGQWGTQLIKREISVMRLVRHPNIVELKEDLARKYFQQLISAVDFCHSRGVSHRDLKPENLLLDENEDLKISDFGLSVLPEQRRNDGLHHTQCGTPAYVAPEVFGEENEGWALGLVIS